MTVLMRLTTPNGFNGFIVIGLTALARRTGTARTLVGSKPFSSLRPCALWALLKRRMLFSQILLRLLAMLQEKLWRRIISWCLLMAVREAARCLSILLLCSTNWY